MGNLNFIPSRFLPALRLSSRKVCKAEAIPDIVSGDSPEEIKSLSEGIWGPLKTSVFGGFP